MHAIMSHNIPNETIKISVKDPPCVTSRLKTAIRRKHRVYRKFIKRGRSKRIGAQFENFTLIRQEKFLRLKQYSSKLDRELCDP